jgi:TPP-dependent pyruvate/acetoin dehydrogenase alpha subunit
MADPDLYRTKAEIEQWKTRDPIATLREQIQLAGQLEEDDADDIESEVTAEIADAVAFAENSPWEPVSDLTRDVYTTTMDRA